MEQPAWMLLTEWGARLTLVSLVGLSIASVAIILDRRKVLRERRDLRPIDELKRDLHGQRTRGASDAEIPRKSSSGIHPVASNAAQTELSTPQTTVARYLNLLSGRHPHSPAESIDRATRSFVTEERQQLERGLTFLATIGSNAPFIGLFGTVLGIIQAFGELSTKQTGSASVMAAISEALIATAVGLLVAIPAVVAYNLFQRRVRETLVPCEILRDEWIASRENSEPAGSKE